MHVAEAQAEVRRLYVGGFFGQLVSGLLWLGSAALATWGSTRQAMVLLVVGGFFIFPAVMLALRLTGRPASLSIGNPFGALGMQVAFVLPFSLPLVAAATLHNQAWFYPAFMVALGAHYLPFVFLYGMPMFGALAVLLTAGGVWIARTEVGGFAFGGWCTGLVLVAFAVLGRVLVEREARRGAPVAAGGPRLA